jgi:hypothetical protein
MGFADLFRKTPKSLPEPRVLICSLAAEFGALLTEDETVYRGFLTDITVVQSMSVEDLLGRLSYGYDLVHLYTKVDADGRLEESAVTGTDVIQKAAASGTKLLWIANGNDSDGYIKGFKAKGVKLNLVMTLDRLGESFPKFLQSLLSEMSAGASMPVAWNRIAPQIPGRDHPGIPSTTFFNGLGQARFI